MTQILTAKEVFDRQEKWRKNFYREALKDKNMEKSMTASETRMSYLGHTFFFLLGFALASLTCSVAFNVYLLKTERVTEYTFPSKVAEEIALEKEGK